MSQKIFLIIILLISFYYNNQQVFAACRSWDAACEERARLSEENDREMAERDRVADTNAAWWSAEKSWDSSSNDKAQAWWEALEKLKAEWFWDWKIDDWKTINWKDPVWKTNWSDSESASAKAEAQAKEAARDAECEASWECFDKTSFVINTDTFSIWWTWLKGGDSKTTINNVLWTIIQKLMIALWVIALLVMTIGAWYIIMYRWHDEYLSKWKNIFIGWITALIVALGSYYLVNLVWYILYK